MVVHVHGVLEDARVLDGRFCMQHMLVSYTYPWWLDHSEWVALALPGTDRQEKKHC